MTKYFCDACKRECDRKPMRYQIKRGALEMIERDLCGLCDLRLDVAIKDGFEFAMSSVRESEAIPGGKNVG